MSTGSLVLIATSNFQARIKILKRGKRRICKTRHVHCHIPCPAQEGMTERPADIDVQPKVPVQLLELRNELANKIHRGSQDTRLRTDWRIVGHFSSANDL